MIRIPPKIWRPKPPDRFEVEDCYKDVDEDIFVFPRYGRCLARPKSNYRVERTDVIMWDQEKHGAEFNRLVTIKDQVDSNIAEELRCIIRRHWDAFSPEGVLKNVVGWEFCIDTGTSRPVACRQMPYGVHESKIIMTQVEALYQNNWIVPCASGVWRSMIVLAPKPHQEHVEHIDDFVWRLCVSYRKLNLVTRPFNFPIPRCEDALDNFGSGAGRLYWISLDAKSGYHQIAVKKKTERSLHFTCQTTQKWHGL
jgi:hypothetical protein